MESLLTDVALWLDVAGVGPWARGSALVYPIVNTLHLLGLVMLIGGIGIVDLRVAGLWQGLPIAMLSRALPPVAVVGLMLMAASGIVLFAADGAALARSDIFAGKLLIIAVALVNAAAFRLIWRARMRGWSDTVPGAARAMAASSLLLWLGAAASGRWIAYG